MTSALARKDFRAASDSTPSYNPVTEKMRALIVDDDRTLREGCASVLRSEGFVVDVTARGDEAIEMVRRSRFDIMFVDVYMTPVSGIDVLKAVMATAPNTLVVLMTGNPSVDSSIEAMQIGAWEYLSKPYSGTQLSCSWGARRIRCPPGVCPKDLSPIRRKAAPVACLWARPRRFAARQSLPRRPRQRTPP